ncbi:MAG: hexosaminidase, partial [Oceanospirillaceae bacterium]
FQIDSTLSTNTDEWYMLGIQKHFILISARSTKGVMHGIQTLLQIIPKNNGPVSLPGLLIRDQPKFPHRGLLLDCSRHFWSVDVVKKYVDLLAYYKMNVLHWHLTEDQGWRVEIKKYPKLTEIGAWRTEEDGSRYGGFYTQEDIREIVAYATARHIDVIPEIELPGHSLAALASYPHLGCTDGPFEVTPEWGVFKDVYCAGNDSTFMFLEEVLTEVMDMFPGEYIHIGGDESPKYRWEHCDKCQKRIADEGLHDEHELQSYFIKRIQTFLNKNNRKLIGWDEILEGGLAEGATVQSWRGMQGGIDAATSGNYAIMSPTSHCYLDYGLESIDLEKIYNFDPIPDSLDPSVSHRIIGGECNMWTEHVPTEENLDSKVFPRMMGLAEVLWTYDADRDYNEFSNRVEKHGAELERKGVNYGFSKIPISFETEIIDETIKVKVVKAMHELLASVRFGENSANVEWNADSTFTTREQLYFTASLDGRAYPKSFNLFLAPHKGMGITSAVNAEFSPYYTAGGENGLTDGIMATMDFRDGRWQGYQVENELVVTIDLGSLAEITSCSSNFYQYNNAWIFAPTKVEYFTSEDGEGFKSIGTANPTHSQKEKGKFIEPITVVLPKPIQARFVKMVANSVGPCPDWHDAAGSPSWLFVDEFYVN